MSARNVEIKSRVSDLAAVRAAAIALGARASESFEQTDTFFNVPRGRFKLREHGRAAGGPAELIYYERLDHAGPKLSSYVRCPLASPVEWRESLSKALGVRGVVRKRREVLLIGPTRVHLDDVERLGSFVELEVVLRDDQPVAEGEAVARGLLGDLRIAPESLVPQAYIDLLTPAAAAGS